MAAKQALNNRLWNAPVRMVHQRDNYKAFGPNENWQADLADLSQEQGSNRGYILVVCDVFTRYAWAEPMQRKAMPDIEAAFTKIASDAGTWPKHIHADMELAIKHSRLLAENNVNVYHTPNSPHGAGIAERMIRTIKEKLEPRRDYTAGRQWKHLLPQIMQEINEKKHAKLQVYDEGDVKKLAPKEAQREATPMQISDLFQGQYFDMNSGAKLVKRTPANKLLKPGTEVLLARNRGILEKATKHQNWDKSKIHVIELVHKDDPPRYKLKDIQHTFYREQLLVLNSEEVNLLQAQRKPVGASGPIARREYGLRSTDVRYNLRSAHH